MHGRYLIIGGTTKGATSSLFHYLGAHPDVCAASSKEIRFFLDRDYPLPAKHRAENGDNLDCYEEYFRGCGGEQLRLEATPDYLCSPGTARRIKAALPDAKILFCLREPISRLVSWYRFAKQAGLVEKAMDFEEFVARQDMDGGITPQHFRALAQGRYSKYLPAYYDTIGRDQVKIAFYEELSEQPLMVMSEVCEFVQIDPGFFTDYQFRVVNPTQSMRSAALNYWYMQLRYRVRNMTHKHLHLHGVLRRVRLWLEPAYLWLNRAKDEQLVVPQALRERLSLYYAGERAYLEQLLSRKVPWPFDAFSTQELDR